MTDDAPSPTTGDPPPPGDDRSVPGGPGTLLARFSDLTAAEPTRLGVVSDLHLCPEGEGSWKAFHATEGRLRAAVEGFDALDVDGVLFTGDLTRDGRPAEFERFDELVADLDAPFAAIPGNHDLPIEGREDGPDLDPGTFARRYAPEGEFPFRWEVGGIEILGLSSHQATPEEPAPSFAGRVSEESLAWLESELESANHPVVTVHHDLPGARACYERARERLPGWSNPPAFENAEALVGVLAESPAEVGPVLTGHVHAPSVTEHRGVREFNLPALGSFPSAYLLFDVTPGGTTVRMFGPRNADRRVDALALGAENPRPMLAAAQLAGTPLADDFAE